MIKNEVELLEFHRPGNLEAKLPGLGGFPNPDTTETGIEHVH